MNWPARALAFGSVAVLGLLAACGEPTGAAPTLGGSAAAAPSATVTAPLREWTILPPRPLPEGLALIIERGCWACDGAPSHLERVYRDASGTVQVEELFRPRAGSSFNGTASNGDFSEIAVVVCVPAEGCGGMAPPRPGATSSLVRSTDAGATWSEVQAFEEPMGLAGIVATGYALSRPSPAGDAEVAAIVAYPGGLVLAPPAGSEGPRTAVAYGRQLLWRDLSKTRFLSSDGVPVLTTSLSGLVDPQYGVWWLGGNSVTGSIVVTPIRTGSDLRQVVAFYREGQLRVLWRAPADSSTVFNFEAWLDDHTAVANLSAAYEPLRDAILATDPRYPITGSTYPGTFSFPALIDLELGTVTPLEIYGPLAAPYAGDRNLVLAVQQGR